MANYFFNYTNLRQINKKVPVSGILFFYKYKELPKNGAIIFAPNSSQAITLAPSIKAKKSRKYIFFIAPKLQKLWFTKHCYARITCLILLGLKKLFVNKICLLLNKFLNIAVTNF
jgi:hypothetical protein